MPFPAFGFMLRLVISLHRPFGFRLTFRTEIAELEGEEEVQEFVLALMLTTKPNY